MDKPRTRRKQRSTRRFNGVKKNGKKKQNLELKRRADLRKWRRKALIDGNIDGKRLQVSCPDWNWTAINECWNDWTKRNHAVNRLPAHYVAVMKSYLSGFASAYSMTTGNNLLLPTKQRVGAGHFRDE